MTFIPGYTHDVFVSYAHVDDEPFEGVESGWVSTLVNNLETILARQLGRRDASIWMDRELAGHTPLTPAIMNTLRQTATLVVVLSPGYLASEWCRREREAFLQLVRERVGEGSRVFVVEMDRVPHPDRPQEFGDLLGYRFWVEDREGRPPRTLGMPTPTPTDRDYYDRLTDLGYQLAAELRRLKEDEQPVRPELAPAATDGPTIFLAEATDDLDPQREEVRRYLTQAGLRVLPGSWYPRDGAGFQEAVDRDLAQCKLFVQLLSSVAGKRPPELPHGYVALQCQRAAAAGMPVLQWRSRDLDLAGIADPGHRTLLERETVQAIGLEEFKRAVVEEARRAPPQQQGDRVDAFVFVNTDASDRPLGEAICRLLDRHGVGCAMPLTRGFPTEIRQDLEANLQSCDALFVVYGSTSPTWVRSQLLQCRKIFPRRDQPLQALVVYVGPPPEKEELAFQLPRMRTLDCSNGSDEAALQEFLRTLQGGAEPWQ